MSLFIFSSATFAFGYHIFFGIDKQSYHELFSTQLDSVTIGVDISTRPTGSTGD